MQPTGFKDSFRLEENSPAASVWLEIISMVAILTMIVNKVTGFKVFLNHDGEFNAVGYYYAAYGVILLMGFALLLVYFSWVQRFKRLGVSWEAIFHVQDIRQRIPVHPEFRSEMARFLKQGLLGRWLFLLIFLLTLETCDLGLINVLINDFRIRVSLYGMAFFIFSIAIMACIVELPSIVFRFVYLRHYKPMGFDEVDGTKI